MSGSAHRITLWGVEVFVATADEASISAAARRLNTSAATVSQQLTNLEAALGTPLLNRHERPITLTKAGDMFLRRANAILNEADQARLELVAADFSRLTRLRLGMIEDFEADVTPRLLTDMAEDLKGCQFLLETGASHRLADMLEARALDVIVTATLPNMPKVVDTLPLMQEPFVIAMPKSWGAPSDLGDILQNRPMIQYTTRHQMGQMISQHLRREGLTLAHRFELDSYHAIMAMLASGAGWSVLSPLALMRAQRFRDEVIVAPLPTAPLTRSISLSARQDAVGDMPVQIADRLRPLLQEMIVGPAIQAYPWLKDSLRIT